MARYEEIFDETCKADEGRLVEIMYDCIRDVKKGSLGIILEIETRWTDGAIKEPRYIIFCSNGEVIVLANLGQSFRIL